MGFKANLKEKLVGFLTDEELTLLPRGFQTLGKVMIIKLNPELLGKKKLIAEACLAILPSLKSVFLSSGKISGKFRTPEKIEFLVGENKPILDHKEHGVIYRFDITKIMFSKGNLNERKYLATLVKDDEIIVDMFAGIGYFSLPIATHAHPKKIFSIELNTESYDYFVENIRINHLEEIVIPINGDSNQEVIKLSNSGIKADRVIMGIFPAPKDFIKNALTLVKKSGTIIHYEGISEKENYMDLFSEFKEIAEKENYTCSLKSHRFVKSFGPNLHHTVLDIYVV